MVSTLRQFGPLVLGASVLIGLSGCGGGSEDGGGAATKPAETTSADPAPAVQPASLSAATGEEEMPVQGMGTAQTTPSKAFVDKYGAGETPGSVAANAPKAPEKVKDERPVSGDVGPSTVQANPAKIELGDIPTNDSKTGAVSLVNTGTEPRKILECKTSCGCTTVNCPKGRVLEPGESVSLEVKLNGGPQPRKLNKTVTFLVEGQAPIQVPVSGESVNYVTIDPERLDPEQMPEGKVVLRAIDDNPFTIKSMYPALVKEFETEPALEHTIYLPWDLWKDLGQSRKLIFNLDHPTARQLYAYVTVRNPVAQRPAAKQPAQPELSALLEQGNTEEAIAAIQKEDFNVNLVNAQGYTPLLTAAHYGNVEVISALLDASADIEATDRVGRTALMFAVQQDNVEAVQALVDAGADIEALDTIGNSALCWAAGFGNGDSVKLLLDMGAGVDVAGLMTGFTPAIWAAGYGEVDSLEYLIDAGADVNAADAVQGATPLIHAVRTGRVDNIRVLLANGADLEYMDKNGTTALLHAAANSGADEATVRLLIDNGADYTVTNDAGDTALDLARKRTDDKAAAVVAIFEELLDTEE